MRKIGLTLISLIASILVLASCSSKSYEFVNDGFVDVVVYNKNNEKIKLDGLYVLVDDKKVALTYDNVVSGGDTNSVGLKELVVKYDDFTQVFNYTVYYQVDFIYNNEVYDTQLVINASEIKMPEEPNDPDFLGWEEIPSTVSDNLEIKANIKTTIKPEVPNLSEVKATYGDTLADLILPKNALGEYKFDDPLTTEVGEVGTHEFNVTFIPNDSSKYEEVKSKVVVNVSPKEVKLIVENTNFTYTGKEISLSVKVENDLNLNIVDLENVENKATEVGTYDYGFAVDDKNYTGSIKGTWSINKAKVIINIEDLNIAYDNIASLDELEPKFTVDSELDEEIINSLNITIEVPSITQIIGVGSYDLRVNYDENPNIEVEINGGKLNVTKGEYPNLSSPEIITDLYYGDTLTSSLFSSVAGGKWVVEDTYLDFVGSKEITITFKPEDTLNYVETTRNITINVSKKKVEIRVNNLSFTYDTNEHELTANVIGILENDEDKYELVLDNGRGTNAGSYEGTFTLVSDYYEAESKKGTLTINKANPVYDIPELAGIYNQKLNDISLPAGFTWTNPNAILNDVGELQFNANYTPEDTNNYNAVNNIPLTINVSKAESIISSDDNYLFMQGDNIVLNVEANHSETNVNYDISNLEVGKNVITLKVEETEHYLSSEKEITIYLIAKLNKQELTYDENLMLSDLVLPTYEFGKFSIKEDKKLEYGINQRELITFTLNDIDLSKDFYIEFDVRKKTLEFNIISDTYTYNGQEQKVKYELDYDVNVKETNTSKTDVGSIRYTLEIDDKNYEGYCTGTLTINKANLTINVDDQTITYGEELNQSAYELEGTNYNNEVVITLSADGELTAGTHTITAIYTNADNYNVKVNNGTVTVNKANPAYEVPTGLEGTVDNALSSILLPEGFSWNDSSHVIKDINDNKFTVTYTPEDTANYNIINNIEVTIKVNKLKGIISSADSYIFIQTSENGSIDLVNELITKGSITSNSGLALTLNVENLSNTGINEVVVNLASDDRYEGQTKEIIVILVGYVNNINVTYGDTLNDTLLPEVSYGKWSFADDYVINNIDETTFKAIFTANDYELSIEANINVTISKKVVTLNDIVDKFEYDSEKHTVTYSVAGLVFEDSITIIGNVEATNVSETAYNLTLNDERYQLDKEYTGTLTINKANLTINVDDQTITYGEKLNQSAYKLEGTNYNNEVVITLSVDGELTAGPHTITATYTNADNYNVTVNNGTVTVNKANLSDVEKPQLNKDLIYGDVLNSEAFNSNDLGSWSVEEITLNKDNVKVVEGKLQITVEMTLTPNNSNYNEYVYTYTFEVNKKNVTISVTNNTFTYDGNNHSLEVNVEGAITGEYILNGIVPQVNAGTYSTTLSITSNYYEAKEVKATLTINKADLSNVEKPQLKKDLIYGDVLNSEAFNSNDLGSWSVEEITLNKDNVKVVEGKLQITVEMTLTPNNSNYNEYVYTYTFEVNKKNVTISVTNNTFTYDGNNHSLEVNVEGAITGEYILNGNISQVNADTYSTTLSITSNYYEAEEVQATLTINKANPTYDVPTGLEGIVGNALSNIELPEGFTWADSSHVIEDINDNKFTVTYTPKDTANYNIINNIEVTIEVNKGQSHLESTLDEYIFMYEGTTLIESKLIELLLDSKLIVNTNPNANYKITIDNVSASITNVGKYTIKIESLEDESYSSDSIEITFILIEAPSTIDITYGDALIGHEPTSQFGTWKFVDEYVKNFGTTIAAVFTSESGVSKEFSLKSNISKRSISIDIVDDSFVYNGDSHELEFNISSGVTSWDDVNEIKALIQGNKSIKNVADSYDYELTLNDERYQLDKKYTGRLEITKADVDIKISTKEDSEQTINIDNKEDKVLVSKWFDRNNEIQSTITLGLYFKGTDTPADAKINVNGELLTSPEIIITKYGSNSYEIVIIDPNYNGFSFTITKDILIARVTTSTSDITSLEASIAEGYPTLDEAIKASENAPTTTYIYVYGDCEISSDVTIGANVELYLPHSGEIVNHEEYLFDKTEEGENYKFALDGNNSKIPASGEVTDKSRYLLLTINKNTTLTVYGRVVIGANRASGGEGGQGIQGDVYNNYSEIINNGNIIVYGELTSIGYLSGSGQLEAMSGSTIVEPFVVVGWRGGSNASGVYLKNQIFPFIEYKMHNISISTKINIGASYNGLASIYASSKWTTANYSLIGNSAIIEPVGNGSYIIKSFDSVTNETTIELYGKFKDNSGSLTVASVDISTNGLYFGVSHNVNLYIKSDSVFDVSQYYKLLPGSKVVIEENATVNLAGNLIVYKDWTDLGFGGNHSTNKKGSCSYPELENPEFIINGTLNVYGSFAGIATSNIEGAQLNLSDSASLEISSVEAFNNTTFGLGSSTITSTQHLFAYNISANSVKVDWSAIDLGDYPIELDSYKLVKQNYIWKGSSWVEDSFELKIESNINYQIPNQNYKSGSILTEDNLSIALGKIVEVDGQLYYLEGYYLDSNYKNRLKEISMPIDTMTLYANWLKTTNDMIVTLTYINVDGTQSIFKYLKGKEIKLLPPSAQIIQIYGANNVYNIEDKKYSIIGYKNSPYKIGQSIVLNSNLVLEYDYKELILGTDYFEVSIIALRSLKNSNTEPEKTTLTTILVMNDYELDLTNLEGRNCYTSYKYEKGSNGLLGWGARYGTLTMTGEQKLIVNANSQTEVYFDNGQA